MFKKWMLYGMTIAFMALSMTSTAQAKSYNTVTNLSQVQIQGQMGLEIFRQIDVMTQGRVKLVWHDAGDITPVNMHINSVSSGAIPFAFTAFAYFGGTLPIANIYSGYPFSPNVEEWVEWLFQGDGLKILDETLSPLGIVAIPIMATPREAGGWFKKEIKSVDDFKGLRFRIGGWGSEVVAKLGAAISQVPATELYLAMDRGRIDAMEFGTPSMDESWGFDKLAQYYYFPGWHQPVGWQWLLINKKVWDGLSEDDRKAVNTVCRNNIMSNYTVLQALDVETIKRFQAGSTVKIARFPEPVLKAMHTAWLEVLNDGMKKHPEVKKAYESFMNYTASRTTIKQLQDMSFSGDGK